MTPRTFAPKYSYLVLGLDALTLTGLLAILAGGVDHLVNGTGALLFLVSPYLLLAVATFFAQRNVIVRFAAALGALFLVAQLVFLLAAAHAKSWEAIGDMLTLTFLLVLAGLVLVACSFVAGRGRFRRQVSTPPSFRSP